MPIVGFYCRKCRANVPLDHFNQCDAVHPDFASAVLADSRKQRAEGVHVTSILGCPRKGAIERGAEVYVDPTTYNSILGGTAWHRLMEHASNKPELCEVDVAGVINGVKIVGTVDRLHPLTAISDWKVTSEWAEKWLSKPKAEGGGMKPEHLAQLSLYGELVYQSLGWRPEYGIANYRTHKAILPFAEPLWDLPTVLAFHPLGGDYSVAQLIKQVAWSEDCGTTTECWAELPLVGETQKYGSKSACDYCSVREACYTQAKGAPF